MFFCPGVFAGAFFCGGVVRGCISYWLVFLTAGIFFRPASLFANVFVGWCFCAQLSFCTGVFKWVCNFVGWCFPALVGLSVGILLWCF